MINLIPNQEKKKKIRDFYYRLLVVLVATLGVCTLVGVVSVSPAFFLSKMEKNLALAGLDIQKNTPVDEADQNVTKVVEDLDKKIAVVEKAEHGQYRVSEKIINQIMVRKVNDIKITRITYENSSGSDKQVSIIGNAPSRERLLLFRRALENSAAFKKVDLPISNFVKGSDIEFSLNLIPS